MRSVTRPFVRLMLVIAVFTVLSTPSAAAARREDDHFGPRGILERVTQFIIHVFEDGELSWPKP
jgi:hypothetical protein